jgi:hypothetical protein
MPITPRRRGIDGRCATSTISARSEFARSTIRTGALDANTSFMYDNPAREYMIYAFKPGFTQICCEGTASQHAQRYRHCGRPPWSLPRIHLPERSRRTAEWWRRRWAVERRMSHYFRMDHRPWEMSSLWKSKRPHYLHRAERSSPICTGERS